MHLNSKHPEIHQLAKQPFDRARHALFGLPFCRFCRERQYSWQVLEKHISCGMCPTVKHGVGRGLSFAQIFDQVLQAEEISPPSPPEGVTVIGSQSLFHDAAFAGSLPEVLRRPKSIQRLLLGCALCSQQMQQASRLKTHWRQTHTKVWNIVEHSVKSESKSIQSVFLSPCQFCGSNAKDRKAHAVQCPAIFQLLAVRDLHKRNLRLEDLLEEKQTALRQSESRSAYKDFSLGATDIAKAFARGGDSLKIAGPTAQSAVLGKSSGSSVPQRIHPLFLRAASAPATDSRPTAGPTNPWTCRILLKNLHTQCYVNASVLAVGHARLWASIPPLQDVFMICQELMATDAEVLIAGHPSLSSLLPRWSFGHSQQDAGEFLVFLLSAGLPPIWCSRVDELGIQQMDEGHMIFLDLCDGQSCLDQMISDWHLQHYVHALNFAADIVCLQLGRYPQDRKISTPVEIVDGVQLPVFVNRENLSVTWVPYTFISGVVHLGRRPTCGHYRSLLRVGDSWVYTNDSVLAARTPIRSEHRQGLYLIFLLRSELLRSSSRSNGSDGSGR